MVGGSPLLVLLLDLGVLTEGENRGIPDPGKVKQLRRPGGRGWSADELLMSKADAQTKPKDTTSRIDTNTNH